MKPLIDLELKTRTINLLQEIGLETVEQVLELGFTHTCIRLIDRTGRTTEQTCRIRKELRDAIGAYLLMVQSLNQSDFIYLLESPVYCACCGDSLPIPATNQTDIEYILCEACEVECDNPSLLILC